MGKINIPDFEDYFKEDHPKEKPILNDFDIPEFMKRPRNTVSPKTNDYEEKPTSRPRTLYEQSDRNIENIYDKSLRESIKPNQSIKSNRYRRHTNNIQNVKTVLATAVIVSSIFASVWGVNELKTKMDATSLNNTVRQEVVQMSGYDRGTNIVSINKHHFHYDYRWNENEYWYDNDKMARNLLSIDYSEVPEAFWGALYSTYTAMEVRAKENTSAIIKQLGKNTSNEVVAVYTSGCDTLDDLLVKNGFVKGDDNIPDYDSWEIYCQACLPRFDDLYNNWLKLKNTGARK